MARIHMPGLGRLVPLAIALLLALGATGCASGPLGSHGVDYIPAFDTPFQGGGRG
jgi:hypothetical protein